jgi:hypothetical protein
MAVSFRILSALGVVYVRYEGMVEMRDTLSAFDDYRAHPDFQPGQKQLVDLTQVTGWNEDFVQLMQAQAKKAEAFTGNNAQTLIVYLAPTPAGQKLARYAMRSWETFPAVVPMIQEKEQPALSILGIPYDSISQLLNSAA